MSSIKLHNVCLDYIVKTGTDSIKKSMIHLFHSCYKKTAKNRYSMKNSSYRALKNISLNINKGDRVGLLGRNGAGKSTLLRVIAKVYKPSFGVLTVDGKTSNLFDVNLGMNVEATGYENITNLAIMRGIPKKEKENIRKDVEQFTELGAFLHNPVRTYSTGMQMKLAFAVATSIPPEIMLIDEIIGAGDIRFMTKATKRLENIIDKSHILALTSHSDDIIRKFCNRVVVLDRGEIQFIGGVEQGIDFYGGMAA